MARRTEWRKVAEDALSMLNERQRCQEKSLNNVTIRGNRDRAREQILTAHQGIPGNIRPAVWINGHGLPWTRASPVFRNAGAVTGRAVLCRRRSRPPKNGCDPVVR